MRPTRILLAVFMATALVFAGTSPGYAATKTYKDKKKDVSKAGLDIRSVKVTNTKKKIKVVVKLDGSAKKYRYPNGTVGILLDTTTAKGAEFGAFFHLRSEVDIGPIVRGRMSSWSPLSAEVHPCLGTVRFTLHKKLKQVTFEVKKKAGCLGKPKKVGVNVTTYNTGKFGTGVFYKKPKIDYFPQKNKFTKRIGQS